MRTDVAPLLTTVREAGAAIAADSANTNRTANTQKLFSIQYLRAIAAIAVVVYHAANSLLGHREHLINLDLGAYGVDVFFVVSGFIMYFTTFDTDVSPSGFLIKRLIRIVPLYAVLSTIMFAMASLSPASFNKVSPDPSAFLESILFIPHWNPRLHDLQPIIGQGWTLNYEMFFYLIFTLSLLIGSRRNVWLVSLTLAVLVTIGLTWPMRDPAYLTYTDPVLLEFCLGMAIAGALKCRRSWGVDWSLVLVGVFAIISSWLYLWHADMYTSVTYRPWFIGVPCALLVSGMLKLESYGVLPQMPALLRIGDASYSLYLVHGFVLGFGQRIWHRAVNSNTVLSHAAFIALILTSSILASLITYRYVELFFLTKLSGFVRRSRCVPPVGEARAETIAPPT